MPGAAAAAAGERGGTIPRGDRAGKTGSIVLSGRSDLVTLQMPPRPVAVGDVLLPVTTSIDIRHDKGLSADLDLLRGALGAWTSPDGKRSLLQLHHYGKLMKISKGKSQCRDFYLFDHVLVYCKREKKGLGVRGTLPTADLVAKGAHAHAHAQPT